MTSVAASFTRAALFKALEREHGHKRRVVNLNKFNFVTLPPQLSGASDTKKGPP